MADRELKKGDVLVCKVDGIPNCKRGDIVVVKEPLLKWPCQNFIGYNHGDRHLAHQQFEHAQFQIGDTVKCVSKGYASYKVGAEGKVTEILNKDTFRLTLTSHGGWHDMKDFKLVEAASQVKITKMPDEEWENNEGWINQATYHGALCIFNDGKAMQALDAKLISNKGLMSTYCLLKYVVLPEGLEKRDVDLWSIQHQRAGELHENGMITTSEYESLIAKRFTSKHSGTCNRRLEILKREGFETKDHFFDDYKKGVAPMGNVNTFKVGDKVKLVDNYMGVSDERTESNNYAKDNRIELGVTYEVFRVGEHSFKVKDKGYWMNPRQFKLADEATTMSKEDTMKKLKIETITYVNDTNVKDYSAAEQAHFVEKYEAEIARLEAFTTKPKKVVALIAEMKADLAAAVAAFDAVED